MAPRWWLVGAARIIDEMVGICLQTGHRVTVLDGQDGDFRASQGNFGLVWLQGRGADFAPYAKWTHDAVTAWPRFANELEELTGFDVALNQSGGASSLRMRPNLQISAPR